MGLFDEHIAMIRNIMDSFQGREHVRTFDSEKVVPWPRGDGVILSDEVGLELGKKDRTSLWMILWSNGGISNGRITLVGSDLSEACGEIPFAEVVLVDGDFRDHYEAYRELRDKIFSVRLNGYSTRVLPSRKAIWCRVSKGAQEKGISFAHIGAALIEEIRKLPDVRGAEVLFVSSSVDDVRSLEEVASGAQSVVDALLKMYEEETFDCESCDYREVCEAVGELKKIREELMKKAGGKAAG